MDKGVYAAARQRVDAIQGAYDGLLAALDQYVGFLEEQIRAEESAAVPDKNKLLALTMQRGGASRMRENLETTALDDLIRFADRVIRLKHWEDGVFL